MPEIKIVNMVKFCILYLLSTGEKHGYDLIKELAAKLDKKISASHVYPFLETLIKNRLIKVSKKGKREKKFYSLTPEGRAFAKKMFSRFGSLIDISIEPKLTTCAHCSCRVYEGGHTENINSKKLKFCCVHCAHSYKRSK